MCDKQNIKNWTNYRKIIENKYMRYVSKIVKKLQIVCKKTQKASKQKNLQQKKQKNKKHALQKLVGVIRMTCSLNYQSVIFD